MLRNEALVAVDPFPPVDGGLMLPRAIDTHVHLALAESHPEPLTANLERYFKVNLREVTDDSTAELYRGLGLKAVVFMIDFESASGHPYPGNERVATATQRHPDVFTGFASVDP